MSNGHAWHLLALSLGASAFIPTAAHGAAFQLKENTAEGLGTAFAGVGSMANAPATVFGNPAGMTQLPGLQISLGGSLIDPSFTFKGTATNAFGRPITGDTNRDGGHVAIIPHGYATYQVTPDLSVGIAVTSPFGLATYYGAGFAGRYQADKTELQTININPAVAYRVLPWLSLGAGFSAEHATAEFASATNSQTISALVFGRPLPLRDGLFRLRGDDWSFGYNFGALIQPTPTTNVGLTYRSRIQHDFAGDVSFDAPFPLSLSPAFRSGAGAAKLVLPDTAAVSLTQRVSPLWTAYADVDWTNWSQFKNLNTFRTDGTPLSSTPERYRNSVFVSVGAAYQATDKLALRAGTAFDKTPTTDRYRTARVPDGNRYWLAIGASYTVVPRTTVDFGYAHVFVDSSKIRETSATRDVLSGSYDSRIDIFSIGTRTAF